jgi:SAM-dependent methyltransferase
VLTSYDTVVYPSAIFAQTTPERLGVLPGLLGLAAPPVATARVLEIGCGDCMNLLAMAAAHSGASFTGFDIAPTVIERGRARAELAGLGNVRLEVVDILYAEAILPGPFDYIIAHGVYAWVPAHVREALLRYIAQALAPDGVAFISYNAYPGCHFRKAVRDLMLHFVGNEPDPSERIKRARNVLSQFAEPQPDDDPIMAAYRHQASRTMNQVDGHLFHDELGEIYEPQLVSEMAAAAAGAGLLLLGDAGRGRLIDSLLPDGTEPEADLQAQIVRFAQERDFAELRYFRASLFVKDSAQPRRRLDVPAASALWVSTTSQPLAEGGYRGDMGEEFALKDRVVDAAFARLVAVRPGRLQISDLLSDPAHVEALVHLSDRGHVVLHAAPAPFALTAPAAPVVSPLARANIEEGMITLCSLDHRPVKIDDPTLRAFLLKLDGSRTIEDLEVLAGESGFGDPGQWRTAVEIALRVALVMVDSAS